MGLSVVTAQHAGDICSQYFDGYTGLHALTVGVLMLAACQWCGDCDDQESHQAQGGLT